jgi:hypothetical protein
MAITTNTPNEIHSVSHHTTPPTMVITSATIIAATNAISNEAFSFVFTVIISYQKVLGFLI